MDVVGGRWDGSDKGMYSDELLSKAKEIGDYGASSHHTSRVVANLRRIAQYTYLMALGLYISSFGAEDKNKTICSRCWHPLLSTSNICPGCGHPVTRKRKPQKPADGGLDEP